MLLLVIRLLKNKSPMLIIQKATYVAFIIRAENIKVKEENGMFREMRRQDRMLSEDEAMEVLKNGNFGVMSVNGGNGYPYGVPVHYILDGRSIYFHSTSQGGHKADALKADPKISFTVIKMEDEVNGKSAVFFGEAVEVPEKRQAVLEKIVEKFVPPAAWESTKAGIPYALEDLTVYELKIQHITGKRIAQPEGK